MHITFIPILIFGRKVWRYQRGKQKP